MLLEEVRLGEAKASSFFVLATAQTHPARIGVFVSAQDLHAPGKYIYLYNRRVAYCIAYILSVERKV
jgi:hypothetical protein